MSLIITGLTVSVAERTLVRDLSLSVSSGTTVGLMGPNGSGKSTLAYAVAGHPKYTVSGSIMLGENALHTMSPDQRARSGLFLALQHPPAVPGVSVRTFFHETYRAIHGQHPWIMVERRMQTSLAAVGLAELFADRALHEGFSGGEKKRLEAAQLIFLKPQCAILDELDAGLDLQGVEIVATAIASCRKENPAFAALVISHVPTVMRAVAPDTVCVMQAGAIIAQGDGALVTTLQDKGYHALLS